MPKLELNLGIKSGFPAKNDGLLVQNDGLTVVFFFMIFFFHFFEFGANFEKHRWLTETAPGGFGKPTGLPPKPVDFVNLADNTQKRL